MIARRPHAIACCRWAQRWSRLFERTHRRHPNQKRPARRRASVGPLIVRASRPPQQMIAVLDAWREETGGEFELILNDESEESSQPDLVIFRQPRRTPGMTQKQTDCVPYSPTRSTPIPMPDCAMPSPAGSGCRSAAGSSFTTRRKSPPRNLRRSTITNPAPRTMARATLSFFLIGGR